MCCQMMSSPKICCVTQRIKFYQINHSAHIRLLHFFAKLMENVEFKCYDAEFPQK